MPLKRIILLRHGQTENNSQARIQGTQNTPLNDIGRQQAQTVAGELALAGITRIISSDLQRAFDTARTVGHTIGISVEVDSRLRERGYGQWEGLTSAEIKEAYPQAWKRWRAGEEPGVADVQTREDNGELVAQAIREYAASVAEDSHDQTLLFVSHGSAIVNGVMVLMGQNPSQWNMLQGPDNCHWAEIIPRPGAVPSWRIKSWNRWAAHGDTQDFIWR
ncbi:histidine phosphatase family protein [Arcanobacterium buesumense]|uniref:Histidine phosphatase family protein n=3 Tax=Arcanobacterium TaxID=28263 RepID=A0A6H2ELK2_9ACTO|nr:histidine phosphatase family protein [Arcanobacterium buesumense]QJC21949.1 histidine phosphatase family protein [Arcanobacterium buesumense]